MSMTHASEPATSDEQLLRELYNPLRSFAAVVGPREIGPDDLLHDAIVRALKQGPLISLTHPYSYLRQAILNEASNQRRRLGRRRGALMRVVGSRTDAAIDAYPADLADLDQLEPVARAVLYLREIDGYNYRQVAEHLDITEANARQIAGRAKKALRAEIEDDR